MTTNEPADRRCRCGARLARDNVADRCAACQQRFSELLACAPERPAAFWNHGPVREALAGRHMGKVCRAYRRHPESVADFGKEGIPQDIVAGWLSLSQPQVSRVENGPPIRNIDTLIVWARGLRIPPSLLWFTLPTPSNTISLRSTPEIVSTRPGHRWPLVLATGQVLRWAAVDVVELVDQLTRKDLAMNRREVMRSLAAIAVGTPLLDVLDRCVYVGEKGFSEAARGARGVRQPTGIQEIEHIEQAARLFREWDENFGGGLRRKAVVGQLSEVVDLLRDNYSAHVRRRLLAVMARLAETSAIMSWDSGRQGLAQRYYMTAFRAARSAEDWTFGANVLAGMSRQLVYLGYPSDALELVRIAQSCLIFGDSTPAVEAMLHVREAWAYARLGRINAFYRAVGRAEERFAESTPQNEPEWIRYFDTAELEGTVGGRLLELAREDKRYAPAAADRISRAVELRGVGRLRSSALDILGLVEARLIGGEHEEAAEQGRRALDIVVQTPSDRVQVMLAELYANSDAAGKSPQIADLRERVREVLVASHGGEGTR